MSTQKTLFETSYDVPARKERSWGTMITSLLVAMIDAIEGSMKKLTSGQHTPKFAIASTSYSAGGQIVPASPIHRIAGSGGPVTLSTTAPISDGEANGVLLILVGSHATNSVTITQASLNVILSDDAVIKEGSSLVLFYHLTTDKWVEIARSTLAP